jgi:hypothetical protein
MAFKNYSAAGTPQARSQRKEPLAEDKIELYCSLLGKGEFDDSAQEALERVRERPQEAECVGKILEEGDDTVRMTASWVLCEAARSGYRIDSAFGSMPSGLEDEEPEVRKNTILALGHAQAHGSDIGGLMGGLIIRLMDNEDELVSLASAVIWDGAMKGDREASATALGILFRSERNLYEGGGEGTESWLMERAVNIFLKTVTDGSQ